MPTQNVFYGNSSNQISNFTNVSPVYRIVALYPGGNEQPRALLRRLRSRVTQCRIAGNSRHEQPPPASATCLGLSVVDLCLLEQTCYSVAPQRRLDAYAKRDVTRGNPNSTTSAKSDFRYSCTKPCAPCLGNSGEAWPSDLKRQRSWQIGERRSLARRTTVTLTARPHRPRRPTSTASGCRAAAA